MGGLGQGRLGGPQLWLGVATVALFSLVVAGCSSSDGPVSIQTQKQSFPCLLMPARGVLVANSSYGVGLQGTDEAGNLHVFGVIWPSGYSARREQGIIYLIDGHNNVVAREGDKVVLDASGMTDPISPCGVQVDQS